MASSMLRASLLVLALLSLVGQAALAQSSASGTTFVQINGRLDGAWRSSSEERPNAVVKVALDGGAEEAFVKNQDGSFSLYQVTAPGTHELSVLDPHKAYPRVFVEVGQDKTVAFYELVMGPQNVPFRRAMKQGLVVKPLGSLDYFEKREQMTLGSIFANPMMLMLTVTLVLGLALPKLMENMDPEDLKQVEERNDASQRALKGLLGKQDDDDDDEEDEDESEEN